MKAKRLTVELSSPLVLLETKSVDVYVNIYKHQLVNTKWKKFTLTM